MLPNRSHHHHHQAALSFSSDAPSTHRFQLLYSYNEPLDRQAADTMRRRMRCGGRCSCRTDDDDCGNSGSRCGGSENERTNERQHPGCCPCRQPEPDIHARPQRIQWRINSRTNFYAWKTAPVYLHQPAQTPPSIPPTIHNTGTRLDFISIVKPAW